MTKTKFSFGRKNDSRTFVRSWKAREKERGRGTEAEVSADERYFFSPFLSFFLSFIPKEITHSRVDSATSHVASDVLEHIFHNPMFPIRKITRQRNLRKRKRRESIYRRLRLVIIRFVPTRPRSVIKCLTRLMLFDSYGR